MKIPTMLEQYLESIGGNAEDMSKEELLDYATYVRNLAKQGEWWGFAMHGFSETGKRENAQKNELTRFINQLTA